MVYFLMEKENKTMKKETSGHKHKPSELSTHPKSLSQGHAACSHQLCSSPATP